MKQSLPFDIGSAIRNDIKSYLHSYTTPRLIARKCSEFDEYFEGLLERFKEMLEQKDKINANLRQMLKEKIAENDKLNREIREINWQLHELHIKSMGLDPYDVERMKREYESGASLRQLAKTFHCDKSTVKRRLIKMGVTIRE